MTPIMSRDIPEPEPTRPSRAALPACETCAKPATFRYRWPTHARDTLVCDEHMQAVAAHADCRHLGVVGLDGGRVEPVIARGEETWRVVRD